MDCWIIVEGYGKMRGREGVPLPVRELFIMGLLAVLDTLNQFYFHGRDGLTVGVSPAEVRRSLESVDESMALAVVERA